MKPNQVQAIKQLEQALLRMKRAGLCMVAIDDSLVVAARSEELSDAMRAASSCEEVLRRRNLNSEDTEDVKTYGVFLSGGGA